MDPEAKRRGGRASFSRPREVDPEGCWAGLVAEAEESRRNVEVNKLKGGLVAEAERSSGRVSCSRPREMEAYLVATEAE